MRFVDGDFLKEQITQTMGDQPTPMLSMLYYLVDSYPTIDVEPVKHGRWIEYNYPGHEHVYCSNCKEEYYVDDLLMGRNDYPAYCPNCGAKLDLEGEEA